MANLFAPIVDIVKKQVEISTSLLLSDMVSVSDLDGNAITRWRFRDNGFLSYSGFFTLNGVKQNAGSWIEVDASQLSQIRYHAALISNSETIGVQVYDGKFWSNVDTDAILSVPFNGYAPVVNVANGTVLSNELRLISNGSFTIDGNGLFSVSDQDGDAPLRFYIVDRATHSLSGRFTLNGVAQAQGQFFLVEAAQMGSLRYISGSYGPQSENIGIMAFDGKYWSAVKDFTITTTANNFAPVITPRNISGRTGGSTDALNLFGVSDADGNTIKTAWILDTGLNPNSGYFTVNGVVQAAGSYFQVAWKDIGTVRYNYSSLPETEQVRMQIFDGRYVSSISTATATAVPQPTVNVPSNDVELGTLELVNFSSLFSKSDAGPDFIRYEVVDLNPVNTSGRLVNHLNERLLGNTVYSYTPTQFSNVRIEGGMDDLGRGYDQMMVRAFNGQFWTEWEKFNVSTEPRVQNGIVRPLDSNRRWAPPSTPGARTELTFSFIDGNPDPGGSPYPLLPYYYADDSQEAEETQPLSNSQRAMVREVLAMYEMFLNVKFTEVGYEPDGLNANIIFGVNTQDGSQAYAYLPNNTMATGNVIGDVWLNGGTRDNPTDGGPTDPANPDNSFGGFGRFTVIHEMGHVMGTKHPFEAPISFPVSTDLTKFTAMSYTNAPDVTSNPASLMMYDVMHLQRTYGANSTYRTGNDQYNFDSSNTFLHSFWDAGGIDTINYTNMPGTVVSDLRQGRYSTINGRSHFFIGFGMDIENVRGSGNSDTLIGNELRNVIWGNAGNDTIVGNGGNDVLRGGAGNDTYRWAPGDGFDQIDEEGLAGRDIMEVRDINGSLDLLEDDLVFRRIGEDLRIDFTFNRGQTLGGVTIKNQNWGGFRLETLRLFDVNGVQVGKDVDMVSLMNQLMAQSTTNPTRFTLTNVQSTFGFLAQPV